MSKGPKEPWHDDDGDPTSSCIGSACMAWRWKKKPHDSDWGAFGPVANSAMDMPIKNLQLPNRAYLALRCADITTVGMLLNNRHQDLLRLPNFGKGSLDDVTAALCKIGVLGPETPNEGYCGLAGKP